MENNDLFEEFDPTSSKAWKQRIQFDLKGADYNKTLIWDSPENISVKPFYHQDDLQGKNLAETSSIPQCKVGQHIYVGNEKPANKKALKALGRGADSIVFLIPSEKIKIDILLHGIELASASIHFEMQFLSHDYIQQIKRYVGTKKANITLNIDIIGNLARNGNWFHNLNRDHEILTKILKDDLTAVGIKSLSVDVSLYQNAGANRVQQLAYALAHANEYLFFAKKNSLTPIFDITFKVSIDSNYFFEIAKLRALRVLWKTLSAKYDLDTDCHIVATPTTRNKTLYDPYVNMLRTTTEYMSGVLGGANTIHSKTYDAVFSKDNEFSERISLNQLLIIKEEAYLKKVSNPSDGSYYIESLTEQMAEKALTIFKSIEAGGGFLKQLKAHNIQKKIKDSAKKEQIQFNKKEKILVGSNKYLNQMDGMKEEIQIYPFLKTKARKTLLEPIVPKRLAEEFEKKRLQKE
ncbi:methylmalonyl-CoA mutase subunit beta [Maribacter sp. HTCC2170]|uniref:methylmalonyl-CoA mutase subunit beta n=1 Tax=Maribacter sp. (strain HTCC2170 / KCCM 42371) TaxID=313603 RepID=UPI00006B4952|nr:methylmalonyl-CoA mutase subunit beta [Maribacter sp. HTCC2170]EAR01023.1 methylmalonyl-CoA mutase small subunit [Maribacter sp. HTCC2170]